MTAAASDGILLSSDYACVFSMSAPTSIKSDYSPIINVQICVHTKISISVPFFGNGFGFFNSKYLDFIK